MALTTEFLAQAQSEIESVCRHYQPILIEAAGKIEHEIKGDDTPVTALDLEIEHALKDTLYKLDPGIGFEGEEHGKEGNENTFWLIDPIDGTESFIRGLPAYRNMVTLIDNDEAVFALVINVATNEKFLATKGLGAYCNDQKLQVSSRPLKRSWIELAGYTALPDVTKLMTAVRKEVRGVRVTGDFRYTPMGQFDGHLSFAPSGHAWDFAPWTLLIAEAGGKVMNIGSDTYNYRNGNFLASNPVIFDDLLKIINETVDKH